MRVVVPALLIWVLVAASLAATPAAATEEDRQDYQARTSRVLLADSVAPEHAAAEHLDPEIEVRRASTIEAGDLLAEELRDSARAAADGDPAALTVPVFADLAATLRPSLVDVAAPDASSFAGELELSDGRTGWFTAATSGEATTIKMIVDDSDGGSVVRIDSVGEHGQLAVAELNPGTALDRRPDHAPAVPGLSNLPDGGRRQLVDAPEPQFASTGEPGAPKIDLMVSYDAQAISEIATRTGKSWGAARHVFFSLSMSETSLMNLAMKNSQVPARIKIQGYYQSDNNFVGSDPINPILDALPALENGSDGVLDDVSDERDRLGADLVIFLSDDAGAAVASGYHPGQSNKAYVAMDVGCFYDCEMTYAHELGHNFGNGHDLTFTNDGSGFSSYSHGKVSATAKKGTIEAGWNSTQCPGCVRIPFFSNPSVSYSGWTTGTANLEDNARTMRDHMYALAGYRTAQTKHVGIASYTTNVSLLWTVTSLGDLVPHEGAPFHGDPSDAGNLIGSVVDIEDNDPWGGYWIVTDEGQIKNYGAGFYGDLSSINLSQPIVAMTNRSNNGYWMVAKDGGVFVFGSAGFYGSLPGLGINVTNIIDIVVRPQGDGYWLLGKDGGVFSFGNAGFHGSLPGLALNVSDAVSIETNTGDSGYWIIRSNGAVYSFGGAPYRGGVSSGLIAEIDRYGTGNNYRILREDGSVATCTGSCTWL